MAAFGESWKRFSASLAVEIFSMWVSKVAKKQRAPAVFIWNYARCKWDATDRKVPTGSMFFIQKTSRLAGGFNFVRIDLKLPVKVGTIFLRLRRYYFSFKWDFLRRRKCPRRLLHEGGLSSPKQSPQKYLTGFWYLTGLLVETKKLLTTDISNAAFISSSRWEAVIFPLERSWPMSGRIKINNAQCIMGNTNGF